MKEISFKKILRSAWDLVYSNLRLWWLGFLITSGGLYFEYTKTDWQSFKVDMLSFQNISNAILGTSYVWYIVLIIFLIIILLVLLSFWARSALILGISHVNQGQPYKLRELSRASWKLFPRILIQELILVIPNVVLLILAILYLIYRDIPAMNILFWVIAIIFAVYNIFLFIIKHYSYCNITLDGEKPYKAILYAVDLFKKNYFLLIKVKLAELAMWVCLGLGVLLALLICSLLFLLLMVISMFISELIPVSLFVYLGLFVMTVLLFALRGGANVFIQSYLTQIYWEVRK